MRNIHHYTSKSFQTLVIGGISAALGYAIPINGLAILPVILILMMFIYMRIVLVDYHKILFFIILVIPFNFESLISAISIPFVNPFNVLWISYVGIVVLNSVSYSDPILVKSPLNFPIFVILAVFTVSCIQAKWVVLPHVFKGDTFPAYQQWAQWLVFYFFCLKGIRNEKEAKQAIIWVMLMILFAGIQNVRDYMSMMAATGGDCFC